ncbi:uncharacterized protein LOC125024801, partial [Penaeus chinensis]|uniref:uncharacterized protein LOC125024801 n=1 Tax=Penaeus chinensis TaxID=139456 RepID=UPI001FB66EA9
MVSRESPTIIAKTTTPLEKDQGSATLSKGSLGRAFAVRARTESPDQASICPWALHVVSVHAELTLGHLRYRLTDVPPQSNSPSGSVLGTGRDARRERRRRPPPRGEAPFAPRGGGRSCSCHLQSKIGRGIGKTGRRRARLSPGGPPARSHARTPSRLPLPHHRVSRETTRVVVFHRRARERPPTY